MKKWFTVVCCVLAGAIGMCSMTGCKYVANPLPLSSNTCVLTEAVFDTPEELLEYFQTLEDEPDSPEPKLFQLKDSIAGLKRKFIRVSWSNVWFDFYPEKAEEDTPKYSEEDSKEISESSRPRSVAAVLSSSSVPPSSYEKIPKRSERISVAWDYAQNGEERLNQFLASHKNPLEELPDHPGVYCYDVEDEGRVYEKALYWVQDNCYFWAFIPIELYEEALAELTAPEFIQQVNGE
ncbi:MAG: hypothetical protein HFE44_00010 [Oscillospiraceae bacterium]|jgi:hypothetical protein|nr:hypothetical protein [Oscillospiraceae bacterium]